MSHQDTDRLNASTPRYQDLARVPRRFWNHRGASGAGLPIRLHLDAARVGRSCGVALGLVRRTDPRPSLRPGSPTRGRPHDPTPAAGDDLSGVPQDAQTLDRRACRPAHRRLPPTHAGRSGRVVSRSTAFASSPSTAVGSPCHARGPTSNGFRPHRCGNVAIEGVENPNGAAVLEPGPAATATRGAASRRATLRKCGYDALPPGNEPALGLADRPQRQQRTRPFPSDDRHPARVGPGHRRRGIRRIPRLDDADRQWATPADPGRIERASAQEAGLCPRNTGSDLSLAGS